MPSPRRSPTKGYRRRMTCVPALLLTVGLAVAARGAQGPAPAPPRAVTEEYESGAVKVKYSVDENGVRVGAFVEYYESGRVRLRTTYRNGALDGSFERFDAKGALLERSSYVKGDRHGAHYESSEDGIREVKAWFRSGKRHGAVEVLERGKRISVQEWKLGVLTSLQGVEPFRKSLDAIVAELARIEQLPPEGSGDASDLRVRALRRLQQFRYLCDVPHEGMVLDPAMNDLTAAAAKLCKAIGRLDHTPPNPGWPDAEYRRAYEGTSHSNLSTGPNVRDSIDSYMDDSDPSNVARVGHRRWCLNPRMLKTGFGSDGPWSAMWSMDASRSKVPPIDFVTYPARGYMPREYFRKNVAWSISSATGKFAPRTKEKTSIVVRELDEWYAPIGEPFSLTDVNVDTGGYGGSPCLVFRPVGLSNEAGRKYWTEISVDGDDVPEIRYLTEFVSLRE